MATTVASIITQMKWITATQLGGTWKELQHVNDLTKNDMKTGMRGYGVLTGEGVRASGTLGSYAMDQEFTLILMDHTGKGDDAAVEAKSSDLFDKHDEIMKRFIRTKLNLSPTVLLVDFAGVGKPELINGTEFVAIRQQVLVKHRQLI